MSQALSVWGRFSRRALGLAIVVLLSLPAAGLAQTITGQISGRITDSSGGVLPGVTVTLVNEGTGYTDTRVTDAAGVYTFTNLRVGTYSVSVEMQGFRKEQRTGLSLTADGRLSADFALAVGELSESVEVTATLGETVNRTSGEVARTIDSQQIKDLAFNGRNYSSSPRSFPERWRPISIRSRSRPASA
jgi:Carboxypeptidase regulatory-like domain